jgi:uncharacterized coiled-coil protein SlyX
MNHLRRLLSWLRIAPHAALRTDQAQRLLAFEQRHSDDQQRIHTLEHSVAQLKTLGAVQARELSRLRGEYDALADRLGELKGSRDSAIIALLAHKAIYGDGERVFAPDTLRTYVREN